jgi:hypothetical protein
VYSNLQIIRLIIAWEDKFSMVHNNMTTGDLITNIGKLLQQKTLEVTNPLLPIITDNVHKAILKYLLKLIILIF